MTYVGQQPATTFDSGIQDRFTGLSSNTVTLTHDISAETDILVVWNNIVQDSGTYSVGGTGNKTLTLGGTLVSADVVTVYYTNKVMQSINPTAGSVGIAELSATGSPSSSNFLRGDNSWTAVSSTTINNNADNRVITGSGTANTLEGEANLTFSAGKNLGIGTASPNSFSGYSTVTIGGSNSTAGSGIDFEKDDGTILSRLFGDANGAQYGAVSGGKHRFEIDGTEHMRLDQNGYLLMDKTTSNTANEGTELHGSQVIVTRDNQYASYVARKNGADGDVLQFLRDASVVGEITVNSSSTAYNTSSDYRLKENVDYDFDATTRLKQLKPARFNFIIDETNTLVDGFLAHEVSSIIPEAISGTKDETETKQKVILNADGTLLTDNIEEANWIAGKSNEVLYTADDELPEGKNIGDIKTEATYKSDTTWEATKVVPKYQAIDQSKLVPILTKALQEAITKIETLETKVTALENK